MEHFPLKHWHAAEGGQFHADHPGVVRYTELAQEYQALHENCGLIDLTFRGRLCLLGSDRAQFLHGQVTNEVKGLVVGQGCYAALVTGKGRIQSDLYIFNLGDELFLDFEPGYLDAVRLRLEKFIVSYDVEIVDVSPLYGHIRLQGPQALEILSNWSPGFQFPEKEFTINRLPPQGKGDFYCARVHRFGADGYDLFIPSESLEESWLQLVVLVRSSGGRTVGIESLDLARMEATEPLFGRDMDENNLAPETGLEQKAISYTKGCYIGQEVIARIRTYGQVAKALRGLKLPDDAPLPCKGSKLFHREKEVGYITSSMKNPVTGAIMALGYLRRECNAPGTNVEIRMENSSISAVVASTPFTPLIQESKQ